MTTQEPMTVTTQEPTATSVPAVRGRGGRPKKRVRFGDVYNATETELVLLLPLVPVALRELIEGIWREVNVNGTARTRVYRKEPDVEAIKVLLDRVYGKAPINVNLSGRVQHEEVGVSVDLSLLGPGDRVRLLEMALERARSQATSIDAEVVSTR